MDTYGTNKRQAKNAERARAMQAVGVLDIPWDAWVEMLNLRLATQVLNLWK